MKIAMLGHKRIPSREGGVEVVVSELASRMAALGHEVTVYSRRENGIRSTGCDDVTCLSDCTKYEGIRIETVPTVEAKGLAAASSSFFAMRAAIADKPDVIHVHAEGPAAMCGMAKRANIPCVVTIHGLDWQRAKWGGIGKHYILRGEIEAVKKADQIIVLSKGVQRYFEKKYRRETVLIQNGIDAKTSIAANDIVEKFDLKADEYILYLGRIVPEKGIHYLIDAFHRVSTEKKLVIAGAPSDSDEYYSQIRRQARGDSRIIFTGFVHGRILEELYSNAYIYVLPSDLEGMPMSLLEAMAYGKCCLVSDIAENVDVIGTCGLSFERGSIVSLAANMSALIETPDAVKQIGKQAARRTSAMYNWDEVTERTLSVYKCAIDGRR